LALLLLLLVPLFLHHATVVKAAAAPEAPAAAADPEAIEHWRRTFASERRQQRGRANNHSEFSTLDHHCISISANIVPVGINFGTYAV
jgi:hypothetical protein